MVLFARHCILRSRAYNRSNSNKLNQLISRCATSSGDGEITHSDLEPRLSKKPKMARDHAVPTSSAIPEYRHIQRPRQLIIQVKTPVLLNLPD